MAGQAIAGACSEGAVFLKGDWGQVRFTVEIADDSDERAQGLMHRTEMAAFAGMLFVYPEPQTLSFWMRNTLIELDMIFIDPQGVVRHVHHRAQPLDETPILGGRGLTHVLEINGGKAERLGIAVGDTIRHPSFAQDTAAWPC
ncbi:MAG: DUF192 domain-containing protein [Roseobacter sp.]|jgi:uncharacterized membrane protein (UPF0127 family)|nr:DUF192 domain-containing protein [Roseobacter sp.]